MAFDEKFFKLLTDFWFFNPQLSNTVYLFLKIMNENINIYQLSFFLHHNLISRFLYDKKGFKTIHKSQTRTYGVFQFFFF